MEKIILTLLFVSTILPASNDILKSAIFPGWGQLSMQQPDRAKSFFIRESAILLTFIGSRYVKEWYEDDYKAFARSHANVNTANKSYQYYVDMGNYMSLEEFNSAKDRRREVHLKYNGETGYNWEWDTESNQDKFDKMRITSATGKKVTSFAVGALITHRIISMIDVLYFKRKTSKVRMTSSLIPMNKDELVFNISLKF